MNDKLEEKYININELTTEHHRCYQMQYNSETKKHNPVFIGMYQNVPVHVMQIFGHLKYICHLVSHLSTHEEIQMNKTRLIGVDVVLPNDDQPLYSYDMIYCIESNMYYLQLIQYDKSGNETIIKNDKIEFPGTELVVEYLFERFFELDI